MMRTLGRTLLEMMAAEHRRAISLWRAWVYLQIATERIPPQERRWRTAPSLDELPATFRRLGADFRPVEGCRGVYEANVPFAPGGIVEEEELLMEVNPRSALSHASAMVFHGITDEFPKTLHAILPSPESEHVPDGITAQHWRAVRALTVNTPKTIRKTPVAWHKLSVAPADFGTFEYRTRDYPLRVTTLERTLIDGLHHPEWCGGLDKVLSAWGQARDLVQIEDLLDLTERYDIGVLRQRVGFVMEQLGLSDPRLDRWAASASRGGSSKLLGSTPFATEHDERWKLSLNAPIEALQEHSG